MDSAGIPHKNRPMGVEIDIGVGEAATAVPEEASQRLLRSDTVHGTSVPSTGHTTRNKPPTHSAVFDASHAGIVRSYSTADPTNDAFTVTHELDFDDWMTALIGTLQLLLSSSVVALGIYLLFTCPEMSEEGPLLFYFVIFSLSAELALLLLICCLMLSLRLFCGQARAEYSSALCGIFHRTMEGAIYFLCAGLGASLLLLLITGDADDPRVQYLRKRQEFVWAFVGLEVALCLVYCLQTIPVLYGICKFATHKLYLKVTGRNELEFQRGGVPIAYARMSDYEYALQHMHNPITRERPSDRSTDPGISVQMREVQQPQRSSAEMPLLNDRV